MSDQASVILSLCQLWSLNSILILCIVKEKWPWTLITAENGYDDGGYGRTEASLFSSAFI
jgi:hypothetical protein